MPKDIKTLVMYAPMCDVDVTVPLYPSDRYSEILGCKNERVKHEKYLVWKLLKRAINKCSSLNFANLQFAKTSSGKWICPDFYFSLSHTDGAVCVAVSEFPIGVDIEPIKEVNLALRDRVLTENERQKMDSQDESDKMRYLLDVWVKKESIFKMHGGEALLPARIETEGSLAKTKTVCILGREYILSVASEKDNIEIVYTEEL